MKQFACGDVVPSCSRTFSSPDEATLLQEVARHAAQDHGLVEVPPALLQQVRDRVVTV